MKIQEIRNRLDAAEIKIAAEERLATDLGTQLRLEGGATITCYDTGTHVLGGKKNPALLAALGAPPTLAVKKTPPKEVFVVYGHDAAAKEQLENLLREWKLEPLSLDQLPSAGQTIIEKRESYSTTAGFAVVLATPDDEGFRAGKPDEKAFRARQNVVLELGMLLGKLGRAKVAILLRQQEKMERPSDIQGLVYIPFKDNIAKDAGVVLAKEMSEAGYNITVKQL